MFRKQLTSLTLEMHLAFRPSFFATKSRYMKCFYFHKYHIYFKIKWGNDANCVRQKISHINFQELHNYKGVALWIQRISIHCHNQPCHFHIYIISTFLFYFGVFNLSRHRFLLSILSWEIFKIKRKLFFLWYRTFSIIIIWIFSFGYLYN